MSRNYRPIAVHASEGKTLECYNQASGEWLTIPGVGGVSTSGGGKAGRSVGGDDNQRVGLASIADVPTVEAEITVSAAHPAWALLNDSYDNGTLLAFRLTTRQRPLVAQTPSGTTAAVSSATGIATFTPASTTPPRRRLQLGAVLTIGTNRFPISAVSTAGTVSVDAGTTSVSAAQYSIEVPALRWEWDAEILMSPAKHFALDTAGQLAGTLSMQPDVDIDDPTLVIV